MLRAIFDFLATGAYIGRLPQMPGTFGTLWGIPAVYLLSGRTPTVYGAVLLVSFIVSVIISHEAAKSYEKKDPSCIIIDEVVGYMVAFYLVEFTLINVIIVFLLFRFFDILKPFPISYLDKKIEGGLGIVVDDVAAGIFAGILMHIILSLGLY